MGKKNNPGFENMKKDPSPHRQIPLSSIVACRVGVRKHRKKRLHRGDQQKKKE